MRGTFYRLGRRRAGSALLATGATLTLGLGAGSAAWAKSPAAVSHTPRLGHSSAVSGARPTYLVTHPPGRTVTTAHAAGHKIA
jgi:hypothetical protein